MEFRCKGFKKKNKRKGNIKPTMGVALALPADLDNLRQALQTSVLKSQRMLGKDLMILSDCASCPAPGGWGSRSESGLFLVTEIVNN